MEIAGWVQVLLALISIALVLNNAQKIKESIPQITVTNPLSNPTIESGKGIISRFTDWLGRTTQISSYNVPNYWVLLGIIIFLFALFRR